MKVKLFGSLKTFTGGRGLIEIKIDSEKRVKDIISSLRIPDNYVFLIEKGEIPIPRDFVLEDNDEVVSGNKVVLKR